MMKKIAKSLIRMILLFCFSAVLLVYVVKRPTLTSSVDDQTVQHVSATDLKTYVKELSESFLPRNTDHPENLLLAAKYIKSHLSKHNPDTYFQTYQADGNEYSNVIANYGPDTNEIIVIGAHYDAYHFHPGADDNASGVAGLIELGRLLSMQALSKRVVLVAYTGEEPPFYNTEKMGSFIHANSIEEKTVRLMISLEMIGYFSDEEESQEFPLAFLEYVYPQKGDYIAVIGEVLSNDAKALKESINHYTDLEAYSINAPRFVPGVDFSDHRNYWSLGYPAVMVTDTAFFRNRKYHTMDDTYDRLNYEKMSQVVYGVFKYIQTL